jgi:hypothetical protein
MMNWTYDAEEAMRKSGIAGLEAFYEKLNQQVSEIIICLSKTHDRQQNEWISEPSLVITTFRGIEVSSQV